MSYQDCLATIRAAAGRDLTDEEISELLQALQRRERYLKAKGLVTDTREAALRAADDIANALELAAVIEKRNAAINVVKRAERVAWVQNVFGNNLAEGLEATLVGVNRAKVGAREGVAQVQEMLRKRYLAGFIADVERTGNMRLFTSGAMDRDIARALWAIGRDTEDAALRALPAEAVDVARVINKWQDVTRMDANEAGAWIGKRAGYIVRQTHDPERIRRAGFDEWRAAAMEYFDFDEMGVMTPEALRNLYANLATGNHLKDAPADPTGFRGPGNLAKKLSGQREIHFKDADAWYEYNQRFGQKNLREAVTAGMIRSADSVGMMRVLGTNPAAMFDTIRDDLIMAAKAAGREDQVIQLQDRRNALGQFMAAVDGSMNIPGNAMWARRAANVRTWEVLAKLGGMFLSQMNDIAIYGSGTRYQGRGFLSGMSEAVGGLGRSLAPQETRDLAAALGVVLDNMAGELGRIGSFAEPGWLTGASRWFMKLNLSNWWVNRMRTSAAFGMSHHMALNSDRTWEALGGEYRRVLSLYDIGPEDWDAIRTSSQRSVDGRDYIVPENVADAAAADKLRTYLTDQTSFLALEPDAKTRAYILQGSRPGTWTGEFYRFAMQFKSFTGSYMQKIIGRELYGRGYEGNGVIGALRNGNGEMQGLASLIVTTTLLGYGSMALKDLAKGRMPRDPTESPEMAGKVLLAALVQGGGAGIYGDFLFGEANRFGQGALATVAGPVISTGASIIDLYQRSLRGDDTAAEALRITIANTPFANLFYARPVLDYMVLYQMQEAMNPGYLRRMERRLRDESGTEFLLRPTEAVR
ncbi:hypothetical protein [Pigmentiphaga daeguensis]|uniref:Uncharacterized protein n=1 Tax=Pigmentiphaga daeguensis TaxID=414049 RepID=A0ABP3LQ92_9BURK